MATKGKSTGRVNTTKAGLFDTRRAAGGATGLKRGTGSTSSSSTSSTINRRKYVTDQFSQGYH
ncbi:MAG: hypothetical protein AABX82_04255 [Nanoarchaeota archaeon]